MKFGHGNVANTIKLSSTTQNYVYSPSKDYHLIFTEEKEVDVDCVSPCTITRGGGNILRSFLHAGYRL